MSDPCSDDCFCSLLSLDGLYTLKSSLSMDDSPNGLAVLARIDKEIERVKRIHATVAPIGMDAHHVLFLS